MIFEIITGILWRLGLLTLILASEMASVANHLATLLVGLLYILTLILVARSSVYFQSRDIEENSRWRL